MAGSARQGRARGALEALRRAGQRGGDPGPRGADPGPESLLSRAAVVVEGRERLLPGPPRAHRFGVAREKDAAAGDERASASKEAGGEAERPYGQGLSHLPGERDAGTARVGEPLPAMRLQGDVALRHTACAVKWAAVKQSRECDICKAEIRTFCPEDLPAPDPGEPVTPTDYLYLSEADRVPPALDLSFDFLRVLGSPPSSASCSASLNWTSPCGSAASDAATC